ncbi:GNAT family acetyltransferase [Punctularia strigosozonata HHB-11173 SS5]|uniref:GNAT family acetyltransferase n=1 Tax=Punctularia strigosozonata (strain HHB-11173) TaxID=741275 RepID=UPI0004416ED2|nr:GNAT family acetyltransferase [Punctularia strigosozonata HHB-11173 SS5]EIN06742.1 GNAT family acetyltransferase [Punctularia strigosozonata HHB-11173 SS5]
MSESGNAFTPDPNFFIETDRLYISHWLPDVPAHCQFLCTLWSSPGFVQSCGKTGIDTPEKAKNIIEQRFGAHHARNGYGMYLVSLKPKPGATREESVPIGSGSLLSGVPPNAYEFPDVGYAIIDEENGKGYATEVTRALISYATKELGLKGVFGFCAADNKHSQAVLNKVLQYRGERNLRVFGGARSAVYALPEMDQDLKVYGVDD